MSDEGKWDLADFVQKIDSEGGLDGALSYGLTTVDYDLPKEIKDKWAELQEIHTDFEDVASELWSLAADYGVDY